jgi:signal transduction histidine kinase
MQGIDDAIKDRLRLMLSRNFSVQEEERRRIARDLHDHVGQQMTVLHLHLEALHRLSGNGQSEYADRITQVQTLALQIDRDLHFLTSHLRSSVLDHVGLVAALGDFVTAFTTAHKLPVSLDVVGLGETRLLTDIEVHLYRVAQEALNNARKHARATSLDVMLQHVGGRIVLSVSDDGVGFDADAVTSGPHDVGLGLLGMRERAALIGGTLQIESTAGEGTSIILSAPAVFRDHAAAS